MSDLDRRRSVPVTALAAAQLEAPLGFRHAGADAEKALARDVERPRRGHRGHGAAGYDLDLTCFDGRDWRATFDRSGRFHSATWDSGSAFERSVFLAVQKVAP